MDHDTSTSDVSARDGLRLCLPVGFHPHDCLPIPLWRHTYAARVIIDRVARANVNRRDGWASWRHRDASLIFGGNNRAWDASRRALVDSGVIECDSRYAIGSQAMRYRLTSEWRDQAVEPIVIRNPNLIERFARLRRRERRRWQPLHFWLEGKIRGEASVDEAKARRWVCRPGSRRQRRADLALDCIRESEPQMSVDRFGRVHSAVSRMPSRLRPSLLLGDSPTLELDVSNAQPLILGLLCMHRFRGTALTGEGSRGFLSHTWCKTAPISTYAYMPSDLREYMDVCSSGVYYQTLASTLGMPYGTVAAQRRVKRLSCKILFGWARPHDPRWQAFRERWPTVQDTLDWLKVGGHEHAAHVLQRLEADLMIGGVADRLRRDHPDLTLCTVHDSVIVPVEAVDIARDAIRSEWLAVGVEPKVKVKGVA